MASGVFGAAGAPPLGLARSTRQFPLRREGGEPRSGKAGPNPAAVLAAAVGGRLAASLTFCLNKARLEPDAVNADVTAHVTRNEAGRFRVSGVTESVRQGIPVNVTLQQCGERATRHVA
jgi:uncharacterized OsmC-like protein